MLQHHILMAVRNLRKHRGSFLINLVGLSTGLACALLIYLWVQDEKSFDHFHKNDAHLFQVMEKSTENGAIIIKEATQGPLAAAMEKDLPEIDMAVPVFSLQKENIFLQMKNGTRAVKQSGIFAGPKFFTAFSFPLLKGNAKNVLAEKHGIVISERLAKALFGSADQAMGKTIDWEVMDLKNSVMVTGVFAPLPNNNSLPFDFVMSYDLLLSEVVPNFQYWWNEGISTYLVLKEGQDVEKFNAKITGFIKNYFDKTQFSLFVRPYSSAYLHGKYVDGVQSGGRIEYVRLFTIVAFFILVIACINFMNLSTARASRRLKEVGIKKVVGSTRKSLVLQFLAEAVFIAFLSVIAACILVAALLPLFNELTGKNLEFTLSPYTIFLLLVIALVTGLVSGSYPAFYLSGFQPVAILKGGIRNSIGELLARKGLVVFQFVISLVLIVSVLVIYKQVAFIRSRNLGYDKDNIISFDKEGALATNSDAFMNELRKLPGIVSASAIQQGIVQSGTTGATTYGIDWPGKTDKDLIDFTIRAVDYGVLETLGMQMKEGRSFSPGFGLSRSGLVFNEAAIKVMGLKDPVGQKVQMWKEDKTIIGVVKDFHLSSLHEAIQPMVFYFRPENTSVVLARIEKGKELSTLKAVEGLYKRFNPNNVFQYSFLDDTYQAMYVSENRVALLSRYFAGLAILISCLGLFGLAAFNAEMRTREIGIRKVLGASVSNVMLMLSRDFIRLILLAILISFPLSWWAMHTWLEGFAYHIRLSPWIFVVAGFSLLVITFFTLSYQSIRTALMNPIRSLRTE